jgi:hypothetical protein
MIKDRHLHRNDTVSAICSELDGCVFETYVTDAGYADFEKRYLVLSVRQERDGMAVRFYSDGKVDLDARECTPNLEDVFLVTYR